MKTDPLFPRRWTWLLFFLAFFLFYYALHSEHITPDPDSPQRHKYLTGDEPHYLLIAHSIAFDGDIDLFNNKNEEHYLAFYNKKVSGYVKNKQFWQPVVKGHLRDAPDEYWQRRSYSTHPIGMPALIAPAYRLGHAHGLRVRFWVVMWMHAMAACLGLLLLQLCWYASGDRFAALLSGCAFALSAPVLFYSSQVYPDLPAGLFMALALCLLFKISRAAEPSSPHASAWHALLGFSAGFMPWIHSRFWPFAGLIVLTALWTTWRHRHARMLRIALLFTGAGLAVAGLPVYYWLLYGVPYPVSTYPAFSFLTGIQSGWLGIWLGRADGLVMYTPLAVLAFAGMIIAIRRPCLVLKLAAILLLCHWAMLGAFTEWRGGLSPPLRYWNSAMPMVAVTVAVALGAIHQVWFRCGAVVLAAVGILIAKQAMLAPGRLYQYRHPVFGHLGWFPYNGLPELFPTGTPRDLLIATLLACAIGLVTLGVLRTSRHWRQSCGASSS